MAEKNKNVNNKDSAESTGIYFVRKLIASEIFSIRLFYLK